MVLIDCDRDTHHDDLFELDESTTAFDFDQPGSLMAYAHVLGPENFPATTRTVYDPVTETFIQVHKKPNITARGAHSEEDGQPQADEDDSGHGTEYDVRESMLMRAVETTEQTELRHLVTELFTNKSINTIDLFAERLQAIIDFANRNDLNIRLKVPEARYEDSSKSSVKEIPVQDFIVLRNNLLKEQANLRLLYEVRSQLSQTVINAILQVSMKAILLGGRMTEPVTFDPEQTAMRSKSPSLYSRMREVILADLLEILATRITA